MAITIIERPYGIAWSRNQIRFGFQTDTPVSTPGLFIQVSIYFSFDTTNWTQVVTLSLLPDSLGACYADISRILDGMLSNFLPTVNGGVEAAAGNVGNYYIQYREITDANPAPAWSSDVNLKVIKGGLSYEQWRGSNFFTSYMVNNKAFLTWQKSGFLTDTEQTNFLFFLQIADSSGQINATFKIHYTDNTEDSSKVLAIGDGSVYPRYSLWSIPTGIAQNSLDAVKPTGMIQWYEVTVTDNSGVLAGPYRYNPDYRQFYNLFYFNFINSLGGIDSIRILGQWEQEQDRSFDEVEMIDNDYFSNTNNLPARSGQVNIVEQISYKGNAGFIHDVDVLDAYRELFLSSKVFQIFDAKWMFVVITPNKTSFAFNKQGLRHLPVEWQYSFKNRNYTPMSVVMGELAVCPVPGNLRVTGNDGYIYHFTFDTSPGQQSYIVEWEGYVKPNPPVAGSTFGWEIQQSITTNTFDIDMTTIQSATIRVKAICANSSSLYSNEVTVSPP